MIRIILNGKKAGVDSVRSAISTLREEVEGVEVRVTYEYGDMERFVREAISDGVKRLVVGGGDGSLNEIADAMAKFPREKRPELAVMPLGTANDFATACHIPIDSLEALRLAVSGKTTSIDIAKANEKHFVNIATGGFGAKVTAETPVALKNFLGGGAYTLMGMLQAINFVPYRGKMKTPDFEREQTGIIAAVCNGIQAGGGQVLAPKAKINDGLLDVMIVKELPIGNLAQLKDEIANPSLNGQYVRYFQTPWIESHPQGDLPINLDGEPYSSKTIRFEIVPAAIDLVLPSDCPCLK